MFRNKEVEIFGKTYKIRYKSIAWWFLVIGECLYWLVLSLFLIFDIWAFISIVLIVLE